MAVACKQFPKSGSFDSNAGDFHLLLFLPLLLAEHAREVLYARAFFLRVRGDAAKTGVRLHRVNQVVHGAPSLAASLRRF